MNEWEKYEKESRWRNRLEALEEAANNGPNIRTILEEIAKSFEGTEIDVESKEAGSESSEKNSQ